ncbi:hypothetical protein [Paenibacillus sp. IITD108]|uniref:hypothetical protein n=1 Tax=Paenibacillus sp. IITD108 TaxID=3116649 RepID=UPI002F42F3D3
MDNNTSAQQQLIAAELHKMDQLFSGLPAWLARQFDRKSGGFYYAASSRELAAPVPDIESTAQAVNMMERLGLLGDMPDSVRQQMIHFLCSKQDAATGCFWDEQPAMREDEVMVSRAIGYSINALRKLGGEARYPLPYVQGRAPLYMKSAEAYGQWLRSVDLSNSWRGCDRLSCSAVYLKQLDHRDEQAYRDVALQYFEELQDKETGLWGDGSLYVKISGTFKLHLFYQHFEAGMPRAGNIYASILRALQEERAEDMCYIRNPIHLLSYIKPAIAREELRFIIKRTTDNMRLLLRADGGFSRELAHSPAAPNIAQVKRGECYPVMPKPVYLSLGKIEGDMNAATQALLIRSLCYRLAGFEEAKLPVQASDFFERLGQ